MFITIVISCLVTFLLQLGEISCFSIVPSSSNYVSTNRWQRNHFTRLPMSGDAQSEAQRLLEQAKKLREEAESISTVDPVSAPTLAKSKDLYDDEVAPRKDPLSKEMRNRLMREASTGLDSEKKQVNVILYISIAVVLLVLIGGQGIFF